MPADLAAHELPSWGMMQKSKPWDEVVAEFAKLEIRWNATKDTYTLKDGTTLP